jgi:hypothetical protein
MHERWDIWNLLSPDRNARSAADTHHPYDRRSMDPAAAVMCSRRELAEGDRDRLTCRVSGCWRAFFPHVRSPLSIAGDRGLVRAHV